jgi:cytochrome c5
LKKIRVAIAIYAICLLPVGAFAQTHEPSGSLIENPVYEKNCAKCHGKTATGRHFGGPSLASPNVTAASSEDLRNIISNGKGHMPKFAGKLTPEEIDQLVAQIKAVAKQ